MAKKIYYCVELFSLSVPNLLSTDRYYFSSWNAASKFASNQVLLNRSVKISKVFRCV